MAVAVELTVADPVAAAGYYESLLAVTPEGKPGKGGLTCAGDHLRLKLKAGQGAPAADTVLKVTSGMLARILDASMHADCTISVDSPEQVKLTDRFGQRWTLTCRLS
jgi:hypothetical protein